MSSIPSSPKLSVSQAKLLSDTDRLIEQARRLVRRRALLSWLSFCLGLGAFLVVLDCFVQREEFGLRLLSFASLLLVAAYASWRVLRPAWQFDPSRQDVARWMESGAVSGGKETATAIQLASIDDHDERFGNAAFRQAAMEQWSRQQAQPAWDSLLDRSQLKRSVTVLLCLLGVLLTLGALWPVAAWTGVLRLSNPWLSAPWPREDSLAFRKLPAAWALGAELQLEIVDQRPPMPEEIQVQVRDAGSKEGSELNLLARNLGDIAVTTLPPLEGSVEVRAVGGDDLSMPWQRVEVIPVPSIEAHAFSVSAPEYSNLGSKQLSGQRVEVLEGSQVELRGRLGERVKSLRLRFRSDSRIGERSMLPSQSVSNQSETPSSLPKVELTRDGRRFELVGESGASWSALQSVSWRFEVETKDGLVTELPSLWGIEVVPDLPPEIRWKDPDTRQVSREASIDLAAQVSDDLGLVSVSMFAAKSGGQSSAEVGPVPQEGFPAEEDSQLLYSGGLWESSNPSENKQIQVATKWRIENYIDTEDLESFEVWFRACDSLGQLADSDRITVRLRSKAEILNSIASDAEQLAGRIEQVLQSQRRNRQLALRVSEALQQSGFVDGTARENLSIISQIQAVIRKQVGLSEGSLVEHVASIVADLEQNQLADVPQAEEMRLLQAELQSIADKSLAQAQEFASRANLAALESDAEPKTVSAGMEEVLAAQAKAILELESLLGDLSASEAGQAIHRELLSIRDEQAALKASAEDLRLDEIANQNSNQHERRRGVLSADQRGLARRADELVHRIREQPSDAAAPLASVADRILKERVSGLMRQSAEEFSRGDTSEAGATQDETLRALDRALGHFGSSDAKSNNFANRAQEWKQLGEALGELSAQQQQLADKIGIADSDALAGLAEEQKDVLKRTGDQRDAAEERVDARVSDLLANAMESQQSTEAGLEQGDASQASASAQRAAKALEKAAGAAEGKAAEFEQQSKELALARTAEVIRDLAERQAMITEGLGDAAWDEAVAIDEAGRDSIRALAADQESIRRDMQQTLDLVSDETTLRWTLDQADKDMARTVAAAQRLRVQPEARDSAKAALSKLKLVAETLNQPDSRPQQSEPNDPQEGEQESQEESNRFPPLMTLKLIRGLQDAINQRTAEVHNWELSEAQKNPMIRELAQRQQALVEQLETLLQELAEQETK